MIHNNRPMGNIKWDAEALIFFNISHNTFVKSKTQMRTFLLHFKPTYDEFIQIAKKGIHPLGEMSDKPYNYNRRDCVYYFELESGNEIFLGQHLDCVKVKCEIVEDNEE